MTTKEIIAQAHVEAQRRNVPVVRVLAEQVERLHEAVSASKVLEMHSECTPHGGCPVAAFRHAYGLLPTAAFDKRTAELADSVMIDGKPLPPITRSPV